MVLPVGSDLGSVWDLPTIPSHVGFRVPRHQEQLRLKLSRKCLGLWVSVFFFFLFSFLFFFFLNPRVPSQKGFSSPHPPSVGQAGPAEAVSAARTPRGILTLCCSVWGGWTLLSPAGSWGTPTGIADFWWHPLASLSLSTSLSERPYIPISLKHPRTLRRNKPLSHLGSFPLLFTVPCGLLDLP